MLVAAAVAIVRQRDIAGRHLPGRMAGVQLVQPTACADDGGSIRLPRRAIGRGLAVAPRQVDLAHAGALLFLAAFSVVTLAMPLGATRLYLFGISVDQQFRTEYLTRLTDSRGPARHDVLRTATVLPGGMVLARRPGRGADGHTRRGRCSSRGPITSIAIAVVVAFVLWARHDSLRAGVDRNHRNGRGHPRVLVGRTLRRDHHGAAAAGAGAGVVGAAGRQSAAGGWAAVVAVGVFLGFAALFYTLLRRRTARSPS